MLLIPVTDILPPEIPNRKIVSSDELELLAESIKETGLITPVTVTPAENGYYRIIAGERRRRAAVMCGLKYLPSIIINSSESDIEIMSLVSDIHKKELHFLEIAEAIEKLRGKMTIGEISEYLSVPEGLVLSRIRLLSLPENIKWKIISGNLDENTANSLCRIDNIRRQNEITDLMLSKALSFREAYEITEVHNKKTVFTAHFKDFRIFENTIERAVDTMTASGISAKVDKASNNERIEYTIVINKMV